MSILLALALMTALLVGIVALLERNHHRTADLAPGASSFDRKRDADLRRVLQELDVSSVRGRG